MIAALTPGLSSGCICSMRTILHLKCTKRQLNVYAFMQNVLMTAWNRLEAEIVRQNKSLKSLQDLLGVSKQAMGHWRARDVPAKYIDDCALFIGKTSFWLKNGFEAINSATSAQKLTSVPANTARPAISDVSLPDALASLARHFGRMDARTKFMALGLIQQLADNPDDYERIAAMIELSIHSLSRRGT